MSVTERTGSTAARVVASGFSPDPIFSWGRAGSLGLSGRSGLGGRSGV